MITKREMFSYMFGALVTESHIPDHEKTQILYGIGKDLGLDKDEMRELINDMDQTTDWYVKGLGKDKTHV